MDFYSTEFIAFYISLTVIRSFINFSLFPLVIVVMMVAEREETEIWLYWKAGKPHKAMLGLCTYKGRSNINDLLTILLNFVLLSL